jgi:hypothetical protein
MMVAKARPWKTRKARTLEEKARAQTVERAQRCSSGSLAAGDRLGFTRR